MALFLQVFAVSAAFLYCKIILLCFHSLLLCNQRIVCNPSPEIVPFCSRRSVKEFAMGQISTAVSKIKRILAYPKKIPLKRERYFSLF